MSVSAILNRFIGAQQNGTGNSQQGQAPTQTNQQANGTPTTNSGVNNSNQPSIGGTGSPNSNNAAPQSLKLEDFAPIFQSNPANSSNTPSAPQPMFPDFASPEFRENFEKQVNFDNFLSDSAFAAFQAGNPAELKASLNNALRASMLYTFMGMGKLVEKAITDKFNGVENLVSDKIKKSRVTSTIDSHPILSNPGVAPLRNALSEMFTGRYPDASPEDIKAFVDNYLVALADSIKPSDKPGNKNPKAVDWDSFLS